MPKMGRIPSNTKASRMSASPLPNNTTASSDTPMGPCRGRGFFSPAPALLAYTPMVLALESGWMVGGHLTVMLLQEKVALLGVVWEDQLWRGQPVYLIVIVPAAESTDADIIDDAAKSMALEGQVVAVLNCNLGGWLCAGVMAQRNSISATASA